MSLIKASFSRRTFGLAGAIWIVAPAIASAAERIRVTELWAEGGRFSERVTTTAGRTIAMRGYMAPPLKPEASFFVLTRIPMAACPFCDSEANWPDDLVLVEARGRFRPANFNDLIEVIGRLELGTKADPETGFVSRVRLVEATYARV